MKIEDRIWGDYSIDEGLLIELIYSPEIIRLKEVSQFGLPYEYYPLKGFTRYEHSIGVMLLLRKLGADLEEQVAGLTHDVSHTAFSHLVDWVMGNRKNEDFQDLRHEKIILESGIGKTIQKHGLNPERIAKHENYSLLERPAPELCADRMDYALREFLDWAAPFEAGYCAQSLSAVDGKIVFNDASSAKAFGYNYLKLQREHWGGAEWTLRWEIFSEVLKFGLNSKIIGIDDFNGEERTILDKLERSRDTYVSTRIQMLKNNLGFEVNEKNPTYCLHKKFRYIDPSYIDGSNITKLSEKDEKYLEFLKIERENNEKGISVKLKYA